MIDPPRNYTLMQMEGRPISFFNLNLVGLFLNLLFPNPSQHLVATAHSNPSIYNPTSRCVDAGFRRHADEGGGQEEQKKGVA